MGKENEADVPGLSVELHTDGDFKKQKLHEAMTYFVNGVHKTYKPKDWYLKEDANGMPIISCSSDITYELFELVERILNIASNGDHYDDEDAARDRVVLEYLREKWSTNGYWDNDD